MARNKKLREYLDVLYAEGSPVIVDKMQLCYNSDYGVNVLQITFRNASAETLYGLSILVDTFDEDGEPTAEGQVEYNYYGMEIPSGRAFGATEEIVMEDEAIAFSIRIIRAEYPNERMFRGDVTLKPMPDPQPLETIGEFEEKFRERVAEKRPNLKPECVPEKKSYYWRCTCGKIHSLELEQCRSCRLDRDFITGIYPALLEAKRRLEEEEKEARRRMEEEEERLRQQYAEEEERRKLELEEQLKEELRLKEEAEKERLLREAEEEAARLEAERLAKKEALRRKKKLIRACIAACVMILVIVVPVYVKKRIDANKPEPQPVVEQEEPPVVEPPEDPPVEEPPEEPPVVDYGDTIAVIGEDITDEERKIVFRLIGVEEEELQNCVVVPVTNAQEHAYLDDRLGYNLIGTVSKSCLLITPTAPGSGLNIRLYNISYCTAEMYQEALLSEGITDADVVIGAAKKSSGTSALTGIYLVKDYLPADEVVEEVTE